MSSLNEIEYKALAEQTGVSGVSLDAQRVIFYDSQTGKSGSNPYQAEIAFLLQETGLNTTHYETLWRTYLINQGVTYQSSLNDMKRDFWLNFGYANLVSYIKSLSGLVAYYPLDETSGDAINQAPDTFGTLNGTVTGATQGVAGQVGRAYSFDGVNDEVDLGADASLQIGDGSFTFGMIMFLSSSAPNRFSLASRSSSSGDGYDILAGTTAGGVACRLDGTGGATTSTTNNGYAQDAYHLVVGVVDRNSDLLIEYIDGINAREQDISTIGTINNTQNPNIGKRGSTFWNNKCQHTFFLNRALTAPENLRIAQLSSLA